MTISSSNNRSGPYNGNGLTSVFPRTFIVLDEDHLAVYLTTDGVTEKVTSGITKNGIGLATGDVTFSVPPADGSKVTLIREVPLVQETDYSAQGKVSPVQVEYDLDFQEMQIQDLSELVGRSYSAPITGKSFTDGHLAQFNASGELVDSGESTADLISRSSDSEAAAIRSEGAAVVSEGARDAAIDAQNAAEAAAALASNDYVAITPFTSDGTETYAVLPTNPGSVHNVFLYAGSVRQEPLVSFDVAEVSGEWRAVLIGGATFEDDTRVWGGCGRAVDIGVGPTVSVGDVTTLAAGASATVANSGTEHDPVFDFGIPQGPQGDTGPQGPQGDTGPQGPSGTGSGDMLSATFDPQGIDDDAFDRANHTGDLPLGAVPDALLDLLWPYGVSKTWRAPRANIPAHCIAAEGQSLLRSEHPKNFAAYGTLYGEGDDPGNTFAAPDPRGRVDRALDVGSNVDPDPMSNVGDLQTDQNKSHTHGVNDAGHGHGLTDPGHTHTFPGGGNAAGTGTAAAAGQSGVWYSLITNASATGITVNSATSGVSIQSSGGDETRVKSVGVLHIIRKG